MIDTIFWRPLPIATLTVRQFLGGKAVAVVAGLSAIPCLFALIYSINPDNFDEASRFMVNVIYRGADVATLLPFTVMILATAALGYEIDDRTLPYLTLKPIGRLRIVLEKLIGSVAIAAPIILAGLAITFVIVFRGASSDHLRLLWAITVSASLATVAYTAIFILVSLLINRALIVGIIYTLLWESLLGRFLPGLRVVSVRHFTTSIFVDILNDPRVTLKHATPLGSAVITLLLISAASVLLATWRLRRMSLD
ncbi:MAG: ABC transporter permease subunit [Thermomicrobiales bacterium]